MTAVSAPGYRGAVRVLPEGETAHTETDSASQTGEEAESGLDQSSVEALREGESYRGEHANFRLLEIGCGTGSTVFPILEMNTRPDLMIYCCDLSQTAVQLVQDHPQYRQGRCQAWVCDVTQDWQPTFPPDSLDVVTLIFVLSAVSPGKMEAVARNIVKYLKPGGVLLFRDYGRSVLLSYCLVSHPPLGTTLHS